MRFFEILFAILLLPIAIVFGFLIGVKDFYDIFDKKFWETIKGE